MTSETITQNLLAKTFGDNSMTFEIKDILGKNSRQFWDDVKERFISQEKKDALEVMEVIISKYCF